MTAAGWSIRGEYRDAYGDRRRIPRRVRRAVAEAMGGDPHAARSGGDPVVVGRPGADVPAPGELTLEDGTGLGSVARLPDDLPIGYHRLAGNAGEQLLLVAPPSCPVPGGGRTWGWAVQLYAARSSSSWGIGDLGDLATLGTMAAAQGAGFLLVSPFWAPNPGPDPEPSPYFPSTRRFRSPLAISVPETPGSTDLADAAAADDQGRALNQLPTIDRRRALALKEMRLAAAWATREAAAWDAAGLAAFRRASGPALRGWATFAALSEKFGAGWMRWPEPFRQPQGAAVRRFASEHAKRLAYHEWVQWVADEQLGRAAASVSIVNDLPVGVDPAGYDAWAWQDQLALGASVGAPPDRFNAAGQDWGLPPFVPHRLREAGYRPFIETVRAALRHAGGLRIDHVLGLVRLWCIPRGLGPEDGAYVTYPTNELLAILAIESHRAGAIVIGEDLGTVPRGVRPRLARAGLLPTTLLIFDRNDPPRYPRRALAMFTTHDLPTVAGLWTRSDLDDLAAAGLAPDPKALELLRERVRVAARVRSDAPVRDVVLAVHRALAASPSAMVAATLEDALLVAERPNVPGTDAAQRANWSQALPVPIDRLADDRFVRRLAEALRR